MKTRYRLLILTASLLVALGAQGAAYVLKASKWQTSSVPYYVNATNLDVDPARAVEALRSAASAWTTQTNAAFSFYYAGSTTGTAAMNNGRNEVFFRNASKDNSIATTYTYSSGGRILDTDIVFWDGAYRFFTGASGCSGGFYIEDVATHEFGHALGLAHSDAPGATMAASVSYCSTAPRWLSEDDRLGAEALYPTAVANRAPSVSITAPGQETAVLTGTTVSFAGSANDFEDGDLSTRIAWSSSQDGQLGSGAALSSSLSVGTHTITARVTDSKGATSESRRTLTIETAPSPVPAPEPSPSEPAGFTLSAKAYKVKGQQKADLSWSGTTFGTIDVYRNNSKVATVSNLGMYTDPINAKGSGSYSYRVCAAGTTTCSTTATIKF